MPREPERLACPTKKEIQEFLASGEQGTLDPTGPIGPGGPLAAALDAIGQNFIETGRYLRDLAAIQRQREP